MDTGQGHWAWTQGMDTGHGHGAWTRGMGTRHGQQAWMPDIDSRHGHGHGMDQDTKHGHGQRAWTRIWIKGIHMDSVMKRRWTRHGHEQGDRHRHEHRSSGMQKPTWTSTTSTSVTISIIMSAQCFRARVKINIHKLLNSKIPWSVRTTPQWCQRLPLYGVSF